MVASRRTRAFFFGFFSFIALSGALASDHGVDPEVIERLRKQRLRPTVEDMLRELTPWPASNPFDGDTTRSSALRVLDELAPKKIAALEKMFPGATLATVGRDSVLFGVILDAFYSGIGQPGRVVRINASTSTLKGPSVEDISRMLKDAGYDPDAIDSAPPFVLMDRTGFQSGAGGSGRVSQSYKLLNAALSSLDLSDDELRQAIYSKIFAVSLSNNDKKRNIEDAPLLSEAGFDPNRILKNIARNSKHNPHTIVELYVGPFIDPRFGGTDAAWHGTFTSLAEQPDGKYYGTPGSHTPENFHDHILAEMFEIIERTQHPSFLEKVRKAAENLNYEFPYERRVQVLPRLEFNLEKAAAEYSAFVKELERFDARPSKKRRYFTYNAWQATVWLEKQLLRAGAEHAQELIGLFLEGVLAGYEKEKFSEKDLRRLIARIFSELRKSLTEKYPLSQDLVDFFDQLYRQNQTLKYIWHKQHHYFSDRSEDRRGGLDVPDMFAELNKRLSIVHTPREPKEGGDTEGQGVEKQDRCATNFVPKSREGLN